MEVLVEAARRVGKDDNLHSQKCHDAHRQYDLLHGIALIEMHAAVHQDYRN